MSMWSDLRQVLPGPLPSCRRFGSWQSTAGQIAFDGYFRASAAVCTRNRKRAARFRKADDQLRFAVSPLHCSIFSTRHDVVPMAYTFPSGPTMRPSAVTVRFPAWVTCASVRNRDTSSVTARTNRTCKSRVVKPRPAGSALGPRTRGPSRVARRAILLARVRADCIATRPANLRRPRGPRPPLRARCPTWR
jgi:hypothetical protein